MSDSRSGAMKTGLLTLALAAAFAGAATAQ